MSTCAAWSHNNHSGNDPHPEACEPPLSHNVLSDCFQHVMFPAVKHPLQHTALSDHNQRLPIATAHICVFSHPASMLYQNLQYTRQPLQPICFPHPMYHCQHSNLSLSYSAPGCCPTDSLSGTSHLGSYFLSQRCVGSLEHLDRLRVYYCLHFSSPSADTVPKL